jgi:SAM-dependent methyltransferase
MNPVMFNPEFLQLLRCPISGSELACVESLTNIPEHIKANADCYLVSANGKHSYPVVNGIPRFVGQSNYADNFGRQWNLFSKTQLDSHSGHPISASRFWKATGWRPDEIKGKWVLDIGCGAGRFAEIALEAGARVIALDYSSAVDACKANLSRYPELYPVQADIYALPFIRGGFTHVYSLGVLQHTPDAARAFAAIPPLLVPRGKLCTDFYWKRLRTILHAKYLVRPFTRKMDNEKLLAWLQKNVPAMLATSRMLGSIPLLGIVLKRLIPVADYTGRYPLDEAQLQEWALLDTYDMLAPEYDNPQSVDTVTRWFKEHGFTNIEIFHEGHLVGRGVKGA